MGAVSKIEWTDATFNPWVGCMKVSPACDNCYAEGWAKRAGDVKWGAPGQGAGERRRTSEKNWNLPRRWNREHEKFFAEHRRRRRVFCASLADVFDNQVPQEWRDDLWALIRDTPNLDWLILIKRIENAVRMLPEDWGDGYPNVWLGVTVESQEYADRRIPILLNTPAHIRFLSIEPMVGPVDLTSVRYEDVTNIDVLRGRHGITPPMAGRNSSVDWVICGGESGPNARPMTPDWARSLRDQCSAAGVPFLFKQWGDWAPHPHDVKFHRGAERLERVGKAKAGNHLDGRQHLEFP